MGKEYWALDLCTITQRDSCDGQFGSHISVWLVCRAGRVLLPSLWEFPGRRRRPQGDVRPAERVRQLDLLSSAGRSNGGTQTDHVSER